MALGYAGSMPRRTKIASAGAAAGLILLALTWLAAFHVGFVEHLDRSILSGFIELHRPRIDRLAEWIATLCNPSPYVYLASVPVLIALLRRRPQVAVGVVLILLGSNVTTQLLKSALAHPRAGPIVRSLPFSHSRAVGPRSCTSLSAAPLKGLWVGSTVRSSA